MKAVNNGKNWINFTLNLVGKSLSKSGVLLWRFFSLHIVLCSQYPHLPDLEGDDLRRLGQEISMARKYLQQARQYR